MVQFRAGSTGGRALVAAALVTVLGGCGHSAGGDGKKPAGASPTATATAQSTGVEDTAAASGGTLGAAGSACRLPVTFDIAAGWKAEAIDAGAGLSKASKGSDGGANGDLAEALLHQGPVTASCEVDAKPAGNIGFLRVWTGKTGKADAGSVLREFVAAEDNVTQAKYHSFKTGGGLSAVEVTYLYKSKLLDETKKECAFAVTTPNGPVVLHLGGMDTEEHDAMLPAYELAKQTLKVS
ncbi:MULTISPECIES: lipoprotein [unclassified Streptomyces]|uniref:lipoprotein n=1 Tax=unclassified Streptomyces TaxID=2593676 RepID=UPI001F04DC76|nr:MULTISPECIES: lipoprotein [unclassified Streptomyces]